MGQFGKVVYYSTIDSAHTVPQGPLTVDQAYIKPEKRLLFSNPALKMSSGTCRILMCAVILCGIKFLMIKAV